MAKQSTKQTSNNTSGVILRVLKLTKGAQKPGVDQTIGITRAQLEIVEAEVRGRLQGATHEARLREIEGTCRSMGIQEKHESH